LGNLDQFESDASSVKDKGIGIKKESVTSKGQKRNLPFSFPFEPGEKLKDCDKQHSSLCLLAAVIIKLHILI